MPKIRFLDKAGQLVDERDLDPVDEFPNMCKPGWIAKFDETQYVLVEVKDDIVVYTEAEETDIL
jgi:hypothetical protein